MGAASTRGPRLKRRATTVGDPWPAGCGMRDDGVDPDRAAVKLGTRPAQVDNRSIAKLVGGAMEKGQLFSVVDHEDTVFVGHVRWRVSNERGPPPVATETMALERAE